jgi:hypothetical protein
MKHTDQLNFLRVDIENDIAMQALEDGWSRQCDTYFLN